LLLYIIFLTELVLSSPVGFPLLNTWKSAELKVCPVLPISSEEILRSGLGKHPIYDLFVSGLYETI
jgi:hypothetical protein